MEVGVARAAELLGVSPQRVRALIDRGDLPARREGAVWLIDLNLPWPTRRVARPLSAVLADGLIAALSGHQPTGLSGHQHQRLRSHVDRLRTSEKPGPLIVSWLSARANARPLPLSVSPHDLAALRADPRITLSGVSDQRANLSATDIAEGYVHARDLQPLIDDYLMAETSQSNVRIRITNTTFGDGLPLGLLMADLAQWSGPREQAAVRRLLHTYDPATQKERPPR